MALDSHTTRVAQSVEWRTGQKTGLRFLVEAENCLFVAISRSAVGLTQSSIQ